MADRILSGGRQIGKTFAAAQRAGMSMDEYRELMRQQHEQIESEAQRYQISPYAIRAQNAFRMLTQPRQASVFDWSCFHDDGAFMRTLDAERARISDKWNRKFLSEYLCEFESPGPEPMGPPSPTFVQWERAQRETAEIERKGGGWVFNWTEI